MLERRDPKITDLERRLSNQIVIGKISQIDHKKARYRVKFGDIETDWLPDTQSRSGRTKIWEGRDIGEQVIISSPCGDLAQGVILGSIHTDATQAGDKGTHHRVIYPDGTTITYDDEANSYSMQVKDGGSFELGIGGGVSLSAKAGKLVINAPEGVDVNTEADFNVQAANDFNVQASNIGLNGNLSANSPSGINMKTTSHFNVQAGGQANIQSSDLIHNAKSVGDEHHHKGVQPGGGTTGEPV